MAAIARAAAGPADDGEQRMGIDDLVNKAREALDGNEDKAQDALDKAADAIKSRTDDGVDEKVDMIVEKAKDFLEGEKGS
ncbi:antitoxin [Cellulomonas sp. KRMCY2]|uniref:antitoxin n=1 Tax=Cellulomonas sp. KRMCY2 TaxID=1304865 RepID=UPI0004B88582|nr:antitoxin [Cellulomonas sp. KRMCY2]